MLFYHYTYAFLGPESIPGTFETSSATRVQEKLYLIIINNAEELGNESPGAVERAGELWNEAGTSHVARIFGQPRLILKFGGNV